MILCVDVHYQAAAVTTACVGFSEWSDERSRFELVLRSPTAAEPYEPGQFYKRELPFIVEARSRITAPVEVLIIDGYVWLGADKPGLGARVFDALGKRTPVVGVAKSSFRGADAAVPVIRGQSRHPLFVTAVGIDARQAAEYLRTMHGAHRVPTLLKRVDRLARGLEVPVHTEG